MEKYKAIEHEIGHRLGFKLSYSNYWFDMKDYKHNYPVQPFGEFELHQTNKLQSVLDEVREKQGYPSIGKILSDNGDADVCFYAKLIWDKDEDYAYIYCLVVGDSETIPDDGYEYFLYMTDPDERELLDKLNIDYNRF